MEKEIPSALYITYKNANSLYEEAQILKNNIKTSRAYTLLHLCFEECGRFHLLHNLLTSSLRGEISIKEINYGVLKKQGYEKHNQKITESFSGIYKMSLMNLMINSGLGLEADYDVALKKEMEDLENRFFEIQVEEEELNKLKNKSLYVTYENNKFHLPDDVITAAQFKRIEKIATISLNAVKGMVDFADSKGGFSEFKRLFQEGK